MQMRDIKTGDTVVIPGDGSTWGLVIAAIPAFEIPPPVRIENIADGVPVTAVVADVAEQGLGVLRLRLLTTLDQKIDLIVGVNGPVTILA